MAYFLPTDPTNQENVTRITLQEPQGESMTDLRVFWGPDICRLEYLIHLLETGRIKSEPLLGKT